MDQGRILYLVNGKRVAGRVSQRLNGATMPLSAVERIEIVRGPQSALYGSESIGGVINIITKKTQSVFSLSASLENRSFLATDNPETDREEQLFDEFVPLREQIGAASVSFPVGPLRNLLSLEGSRGDFYGKQKNSSNNIESILPEYYRGGGGLDTALSLGESAELSLGASFMMMQSDGKTYTNDNLTRNKYLRADGYAELEFTPLESTGVTLKVYDTFYDRDNDSYAGVWTAGKKHENENLAVLDLQAVYEGLPHFLFTGGIEAAYHSMAHFEFKNTAVIDKEALFFQAEWFTEDNHSLIGGVRVERNSQFGFMAAPKLSGMYYFFPGFRILGGAGLGYRAPAFNELYRDFISTRGTKYHIIPNPDIKPEYSASFNLGAEYATPRGFLRTNGFYTELFNEIETVDSGMTETINSGTYRIDVRENIARSLRAGVDTEGQLSLLNYFFVSAGYSWIYAYDRTRAEEKHDQPAHTAKGKIGFNYNNDGRTVTRINTYFQGRFFSPRGDDTYDDDNPRFVLDFNLTVGLGKHFTVHTSVNNITGAVYRFGPDTGQSIAIGLLYSL
jgi:outer membrane receptor for ferrienterochelin and colicins